MDSSFFFLMIYGSFTLLGILLFRVYKKFRFNPQNETVASPSSSPKYDVFPSVHWKDVNKSFLTQILQEFSMMGINAFPDGGLKLTNSTGVELLEAIRGSSIAIVMLSRNYASFSLCLDELVEIIKCREVSGQVVVPVFYEVDPTDVKKQTGDFGKVFSNTCTDRTEEETERWSRALEKVATIEGYHTSKWDDETDIIKSITTRISNILNISTPSSSSDFQGLVGKKAPTEITNDISDKEVLYTGEQAFNGTSSGLLHSVYIYCADTLQYSFASHLAMDFRRKGIYAFVNCNKTLDAIEAASAFVVVFSKNYLSSTSCLDNLVGVLQCPRITSQLVVPVYYDISPSYVVLQQHEPADRISEWSTALQEVRDLPGHHSREECSESKLVEEIVKDVYEKLFPTNQIGINLRLKEIKQLLCKQPLGIRRIGIWGMPGIGKTTLAKAFFDQISGGYEASCFIKHFDKAFHEKGPHRLLEEHFGKVLKELPRACSSITRPSLPRDILSKKRTLVVLDDVRNPLVAEAFLGGFHWFGPGSLIIITSRDKRVFRLCQISHVYEVQRLDKAQARKLFSQCAFGEKIKQKALELSKKVIDYANGNPLALSFYGGELKGKKLSEMETTFLKFKLRIPYKIRDLFESGYESLKDTEKNIFLDIACFFNENDVEYVMQLHEGCGFFPRDGIDVLVEKCLVTLSENKVHMQNLVQDFGREIIIRETVHIERRRRLWEPWTIKFLLEDQDPKATYKRALGTEDIEGIYLDIPNLKFDVKPRAFEDMYNLRILKICSKHRNRYQLRLPKGLESLPSDLRLLHWDNYPLRSFPQDFDPCHLVELNMFNSRLHKLWGGTKNLDKLKTVRLCNSQQLTEIEDICKAQNIKVIDLQGCTKLQSFPATSQLQHLQIVDLTGCREVKKISEVSPNIEELCLEETALKELPVSIGNAKNLGRLDLSNCSSLMELPTSIGNAVNLKVLDLRNCTSLVELPSSFGNLINLEELCMRGCSSLERLPDSFGNAINLKILDLSKCSNLLALPSSLGNAKNLEILDLSRCSSLVELPYSFGNFINLRELSLDNCSSLIMLPVSFGKAIKLRKLNLDNCSSLVEVPSSFGNLGYLSDVSFGGCSSLLKIPDSWKTRIPSHSGGQ